MFREKHSIEISAPVTMCMNMLLFPTAILLSGKEEAKVFSGIDLK
jgi:hypothetical protein